DAPSVVGDGSGPLTVDGTVTWHETPLSQLVHARAIPSGCSVLATPPSGKGMVVRSVAVNVFENPSPGDSNWWPLYNDTTCGHLAATDNPGQVGCDSVSLDPGVRAARRYPLGRRGSQRGTARRYASYGSPNER